MSEQRDPVLSEQEMLARETEIQAKNAFCVHNRIELADVKKDYAEVSLKLAPESMNFRENVHGGAYFAMADMCAGIVCRTDGRVYVTQHASVEYIRGITGGVLTGRGPKKDAAPGDGGRAEGPFGAGR